MNIIKKDIQDLIPSGYNPRKKLKSSSPEYKRIKASIEKFGYVDPIIVNSDNTVIGGHQRLKVLKDLGYISVDVIEVDLDKEDEKALNLALNKITGQWDEIKLNDLLIELNDIDFDLSLTGFDKLELNILDTPKDQEVEEVKENERIRTSKSYNLDLYDESEVDGFYEMPLIHKESMVPKDLIGFNYMLTSKERDVGVHMYVDDYQFERLWNNPDKYLEELSRYQCVLTPDFSLYMDMPMAMKIWNVYRSRMLGQYWQRNGIRVIPTISWAEQETYQFCFDGIEKGSIVSISTIGVKREKEALKIWCDGVTAMIKHIRPSMILVYGGYIEFDYQGIPVKYYDNKVTERMKETKKVK